MRFSVSVLWEIKHHLQVELQVEWTEHMHPTGLEVCSGALRWSMEGQPIEDCEGLSQLRRQKHTHSQSLYNIFKF